MIRRYIPGGIAMLMTRHYVNSWRTQTLLTLRWPWAPGTRLEPPIVMGGCEPHNAWTALEQQTATIPRHKSTDEIAGNPLSRFLQRLSAAEDGDGGEPQLLP